MAGLTRLAPFFGIIGLIAALSIYAFIKKQPNSNNRLQQLEQTLNNGVMAFLVKEYSMLALFAAAVFIILWLTLKEWQTSLAFVSGALCSVVACYSGMTAILNSNSKILETANRSELVKARNEAFLSASVMGLTVAGLGLLGVGIWFFIYGSDALMIRRITGFALGASSAALFARLSGGIFSRAASFGTEIACRMEAGIPYNSPQNPGVIARSAATSIVDIAGMGADLFESFAGSVIAAIFIGATFSVSSDIITLFPDLKPVSIEEAINIIRLKYMALPVLIIIAGLLSSIAALFSIKISRGTDSFRMHRYAVLSAAGVFLIISAAIITAFGMPFGTFWALFSGLVCGIAAGFSAGYYTLGERAGYIAAHSKTGAAAGIMAGLSAGMLSTYIPAACICAATLTGYMASGAYGTALAAVGMIATIGINMTVHGFSPVARNAQTMSEMAGLSPETASIAKQLDSPEKGGSSAGKVFASVSAALTALALFYAFVQSIQVSHPE
ncbi:MAG: sodium/proton-translocating pyrophosphatase, partial [Deltaproteobacteria bacterium]|nr:sodium/proton-translocating pyrophosphatase [Deltaproteobacteria bacterium]